MSMLGIAIKRIGELTATVEFLKRRVDHYRNRAEHYRSRFVEVIRKNNDLRRQAAAAIDTQKSCRNANADARDKALEERDSLRLEVQKLNKLYADSRNQWYKADQQRDSAVKQLELSQATVIQIDALRALFGPRPASEVYAAQSELELLRVIRKSQGEGITKLRQQLTEACKERDAASVRNEGLRKQLFGVQEDNERVKIELRDAREATNAGAIRYCDVCKERDAWRQEALNLEVSLHGLGLCSCRVVYSNPVEAMKANPRLSMMLDEDLDRRHFLNQDVIRRDNSRNVDNQKAYEAPNCPSS